MVAPRSTCGAAATSSTSARSIPDTGKTSEETVRLYITVPFLVTEAPTLTLDQPAEGATFENGAIPVQGQTTNATSVVVSAAYVGPADAKAGKATPKDPPKAPKPVTVKVGDDGAFSTPLELTSAKWAITVTATSAEGKSTSLTRNVTVAFKGVNVVVSIKSGRAWLKVWVDGKVSDQTTAAGRVYAPGQGPDVHGQEVRRGPDRQVERDLLHGQRDRPRAHVRVGQPGDLALRAARRAGADRPALTPDGDGRRAAGRASRSGSRTPAWRPA